MIVAGRRVELLDQIAAEHPGIETMVLDVTDPASITGAASSLAASHPQLNVLVNNAGIMRPENLLDASHLPTAEDHVVTNLLGPIRMTYAFLPQLVTHDDAAILNVTSALGFVPWPATATYSATKAALHSFTESLRIQLSRTPVQVIELVPPGVQTTLMGQQDSPHAMPLDEFLTEALALLADDPDAQEIVVKNAEFARHAAASGTYDQVLAMLSGTTA